MVLLLNICAPIKTEVKGDQENRGAGGQSQGWGPEPVSRTGANGVGFNVIDFAFRTFKRTLTLLSGWTCWGGLEGGCAVPHRPSYASL